MSSFSSNVVVTHPHLSPACKQTLLIFDSWKEKYGVSYAHEEEEAWHLNTFKENLDVIRAHRQRFLGRPEPYSVGLNRFSDMTWCVFLATAVDDGCFSLAERVGSGGGRRGRGVGGVLTCLLALVI